MMKIKVKIIGNVLIDKNKNTYGFKEDIGFVKEGKYIRVITSDDYIRIEGNKRKLYLLFEKEMLNSHCIPTTSHVAYVFRDVLRKRNNKLVIKL